MSSEGGGKPEPEMSCEGRHEGWSLEKGKGRQKKGLNKKMDLGMNHKDGRRRSL